MKSNKLSALILCFILLLTQLPNICIAQDSNQQNETKKEITLPANTPIILILLESINSQRNREGDEVVFSIAEDVVIMGRTYLVKGTPVIGRVTHVKSAKGWGKSGNFDVELTSLFPLYSMPIKLTGETSSSTGARTGLAVGGAVFAAGVSVVGLLVGGSIKGKKAKIDPGMSISIYTAENGQVMDISIDEMRKMVDDWYHNKIISSFLNYSWDGKGPIIRIFESLGYSVDKSNIQIKSLDDYYYQIDVILESDKTASFKFQPFEEGYTSKYRRIEELNELAQNILKSVK